MQLFFALSRVGINRDHWSKKKFASIVTTYLETLPGAQFHCLKETTRWDMYLTLIPVNNDQEALALRKQVETLCKQVSSRCRPYYFRCRRTDVQSISQLNMFGLTAEENRQFQDKAPVGVPRYIDV